MGCFSFEGIRSWNELDSFEAFFATGFLEPRMELV